MPYRSIRLDAVFGGPLSASSGPALRKAIDSGLAESQELDWKVNVPEDLPARVCGFANSQGGAIVIGVGEHPDRLEAVPLYREAADHARAKISQQLASNCYPMLRFEIEVVPDSSLDGHAYVVLLVPPSTDAPHAVADRGAKGKLLYPLRVDTTTEYMTEAMVAAAYLHRFGRTAETSDRLAAVIEMGMAGLSRQPELWLYLGLVPAQRQRRTFDRALYAATSRWLQEPGLGSIGHGGLAAFHPMPHVNRTVLVAPGHGTGPGAHFETYELHGDGAGFAAWQIEFPEREEGMYLSQSQLVDTLIKQVNVLAHYSATIAGASGPGVVEVGIADWNRSAEWSHSLNFGEPRIPPSVRVRPLVGSHNWQIPVDIGAIAGSTLEMLDAARILSMGMMQAFGYVEPTLIASGGWINSEVWPDPDAAARWAEEHGALVT